MNRFDFCDMLVAAKEQSGKSTNTVSFDLRMQWSTLRRFEKGVNNPSMKKIFNYLDVVNSVLTVNHKGFSDANELVEYLVKKRTGKFSQRQLATAIGISSTMVARIESGMSNLTLDVFLKIVDVLGCTIKIRQKL